MRTIKFDMYGANNQSVKDACTSLAANICFLNRKNKQDIKTITVCSYDEQVGKTTTAIELAISLAESGHKILLVDADFRKNGSNKGDGEFGKGLLNYLESSQDLKQFLNSTNIANLSYLSCGSKQYNPIETFFSEAFDQFIIKTKREYDFVIFDTTALSLVIDGAMIASKTDAALLVVQFGLSDEKGLILAKEQLLKANAYIAGIVLTKVKDKPIRSSWLKKMRQPVLPF